jgi:hypothetical protein
VTIRVHVERLVLEGWELRHAERGIFERAVVAELTRLLERENEMSGLRGAMGGGAVPSLAGGQLQFGARDSAASLGTLVGRSVHHALVPSALTGMPERVPAPAERERAQ